MARCRTKSVCGVKCTSPDGRVWTWMMGSETYNWCLAGQFRIRCRDHGEQLLGFHKRIDSAVGWTMGWHERSVALRGKVEKPGGEETAPSVASS